MKYDFETLVSRRPLSSMKWQLMLDKDPNIGEQIVPLSVADMEFKNPPELIEGLKAYLDKAPLGYTVASQEYIRAVTDWMKNHHSWDIKPEWILPASGVVPAIYTIVKAFTRENEGVIIMPPVYYPFASAVQSNNRKLVNNPLIYKDNHYSIDFDDLEAKAKDPNNKLLIFCSPHNPIGRVWTKEELARVGRICIDNNVLIVSDEIHFDFVMPGYKHTVFANISEEFADHSIICTAPSKTFNMAGLQISNIIIKNKEIRDTLIRERDCAGFWDCNMIGYKACEIAYTQCQEWLAQLLEVIRHNYQVCTQFIEKHLPQITVARLEGTYLLWLDLRALNLCCEEQEKCMLCEDLYLDEGYLFGENGKGFERINLACPTFVLEAAMERLRAAVNKHSK